MKKGLEKFKNYQVSKFALKDLKGGGCVTYHCAGDDGYIGSVSSDTETGGFAACNTFFSGVTSYTAEPEE